MPAGAELRTLDAAWLEATLREGSGGTWAEIERAAADVAFAAGQANRTQAMEGWLLLTKWSRLLGENQQAFTQRWIEALNSARLGHPNMPRNYNPPSAPLSTVVSAEFAIAVVTDFELSQAFFDLLTPYDHQSAQAGGHRDGAVTEVGEHVDAGCLDDVIQGAGHPAERAGRLFELEHAPFADHPQGRLAVPRDHFGSSPTQQLGIDHNGHHFVALKFEETVAEPKPVKLVADLRQIVAVRLVDQRPAADDGIPAPADEFLIRAEVDVVANPLDVRVAPGGREPILEGLIPHLDRTRD